MRHTARFVVSVFFIVGLSLMEAQTIEDTSDPQPNAAQVSAASGSNSVTVTVNPFADPEVSIVPATASLPAESSLNASALAPLLPYSVVIRNNSSKSVIAYTVSWISKNTSGKTNSDYRTVCDANSFKGIAPQSEELVTIIGPPLADNPQLSTDVSQQIEAFQAWDSVTISLDAVMFEDGTTKGSDPSQSLAQIRGRIRAEHDLFVSTLATNSNSVITWLQPIRDSVKPGTMLDLSKDPFGEWYRFYQARIASQLLKIVAEKGASKMLDDVNTAFSTKQYPNI